MTTRDHHTPHGDVAPLPANDPPQPAPERLAASGDGAHAAARPTNPVMWIADRLTSVKLGITTLTLLFIYSALGSAGHYPVIRDGGLAWSDQMLRQLRPFEMTEFEWFHTPVFVALVALLCINLTLVTVRKIPFNTLKLGVWMIHSGIIIMTLGATWYFFTKYEGDTPVLRRAVAVDVEGVGSVQLPAKPGAVAVLHDHSVTPDGSPQDPNAQLDPDDHASHGHWRFEVADVNPAYRMLSAGMEGVEDFAVTVRVTRPDGESFFRQLLQEHPSIVEDAVMVPTTGPDQRPMQRVKNLEEFGGRLLFDERVSMDMRYEPQRQFWVKDSFAVALREVAPGDETPSPWDQRLIDGMPRYNDYIDRPDDIWPPIGVSRIALDPIALDAPANGDAATPTSDLRVRVTGYLRYAVLQDRWGPGPPDGELFPVVTVRARLDGGDVRRAQLAAFDSSERTAFDGLLGFYWAADAEQLDDVRDRMRGGLLTISVGGASERLVVTEQTAAADDHPFIPIADSGFAYRVRQVVDRLVVPGLNDGVPVSVVEVELRTPESDLLRRWVFDDPELTRDLPDGADLPTATAAAGVLSSDPRVQTAFRPGAEEMAVVAGPDDVGIRIMLRPRPGGEPLEQRVTLGQVVPVAQGVGLSVDRLLTSAERVTKPFVIPRERRNQDTDRSLLLSMARVELLDRDGSLLGERWLPYHPYSFNDTSLYAGRLGEFRPAVFNLPDGRTVQAIFTREKRDLPHQIALDDFELRAHVGGFTGESLSIRDWVSHLRFRDDAARDWGERREVRVNSPREQDGVWYFQAFWDAPMEDAQGLMGGGGGKTFTGLGVGNREGVYTTLFGATLSVIGMMYAFYVKPIIKRRRQERVYRELAAAGAAPDAAAGAAAAHVDTADRNVAKELA